jgi:hypothetical protein
MAPAPTGRGLVEVWKSCSRASTSDRRGKASMPGHDAAVESQGDDGRHNRRAGRRPKQQRALPPPFFHLCEKSVLLILAHVLPCLEGWKSRRRPKHWFPHIRSESALFYVTCHRLDCISHIGGMQPLSAGTPGRPLRRLLAGGRGLLRVHWFSRCFERGEHLALEIEVATTPIIALSWKRSIEPPMHCRNLRVDRGNARIQFGDVEFQLGDIVCNGRDRLGQLLQGVRNSAIHCRCNNPVAPPAELQRTRSRVAVRSDIYRSFRPRPAWL